MIGPKGFFALAVPLTFSMYMLLLGVQGKGILSIWISGSMVTIFSVLTVVALLRLGEKEEERLLSDHMHIRD